MDFLSKLGIGQPDEVRKNKRLINQTKQRQEQLLKSLNVGIQQEKSKIDQIYQLLGQKVAEEYLGSVAENLDKEAVKEYIEKIEEKNTQIKAFEEKKSEIIKRYGEELEMLRKLIPQEDNNPSKNQKKSCPECGEEQQERAKFCISCGHKFE